MNLNEYNFQVELNDYRTTIVIILHAKMQRMRELHEREMQGRGKSEMADRMNDLGRAIRGGGQKGDVAHAGKRKRDEDDYVFVFKQRTRDRQMGPQIFNIAT